MSAEASAAGTGSVSAGALTLRALLPVYADAMRVRQFAAATIETQGMLMRWFVEYAEARAVRGAGEVTRDLIERYQRHLYAVRVRIGGGRGGHERETGAVRPLSIRGQHARLYAVVRFFRWAMRAGHVPHTPAEAIELPRLPRILPKPAFTAAEVERVLAVPDIATPSGLRDRAMMEVFYATGIRRGELVALSIDDLDRERGIIAVREGKGRKGRMVPISRRALAWVDRYIATVWTRFPQGLDHRRLFISVDDAKRRHQGAPLATSSVTQTMGSHLVASGVEKAGACHIFRHTAATLMMENGADVRAIQDFLGHADLKTTGIYTNVSLQFLKDQHTKAHPSARSGSAGMPPAAPAAGAGADDDQVQT